VTDRHPDEAPIAWNFCLRGHIFHAIGRKIARKEREKEEKEKEKRKGRKRKEKREISFVRRSHSLFQIAAHFLVAMALVLLT